MDLMDQKQEREIGGVKYQAWPLPFGVARPALVRLIGLSKPLLAGYLRGTDKADKLAGFLDALQFTDDDLKYFSDKFGDASRFQSGDQWAPLVAGVQDQHFAGRLLEYFQWLTFCIEVNFASFFVGVKSGSGVDALRTMMTSQ